MNRILDRILRHFISSGRLHVAWPDGSQTHYSGSKPGPEAGMKLVDNASARALAMNPGLGFGEGYMNGGIQPMDCTLYQLLDLLMLNAMSPGHLPEQIASTFRYACRSWIQFNPIKRARQNVAHHYDLDSRLYDLFLDKDRQYSCAYFRRGDETLDEAQEAKKKHIASKLLLNKPGLEVLDIGCG